MQEMMIQDFPAVPETKVGPSTEGLKELPEQPFGEVLGSEAEKAVESAGMSAEEVVLEQEVPVDEMAQEIEAEKSATPFFMAALFDQSAPLVKPSENAELVVAAERVQELVGTWLQAQEEGEAVVKGMPIDQTPEQPSNEELMIAAMEVLDQAVETTTQPAEVAPQQQQPVLSSEDVEELKQLMAVMMQSGQVPEQYQGHPLIAELKQQVAGVQAVVGVEQSKGQTVKSEIATSFAAKNGTEVLETSDEVQPDVKVGLQEKQIAGLLKPRNEQPTLHELKATKVPLEQQVEVALVVEGETGDIGDLQPEKAKVGVGGDFQPQQIIHPVVGQRLDPQVAATAPKMMQLPSGQQVAENQLVDQVVTYLAGSSDGESGRMRLRLHPAELGTLRLDLMVEGDRVRAHIHAQTQQVQEVLDRYLPQLRDALQQQGLKIDEFRVDVQGEQDQADEQAYAWQQQQQEDQDHSGQGPWQADDWQQDLELPLEQLLQQTHTGLSVRV